MIPALVTKGRVPPDAALEEAAFHPAVSGKFPGP